VDYLSERQVQHCFNRDFPGFDGRPAWAFAGTKDVFVKE